LSAYQDTDRTSGTTPSTSFNGSDSVQKLKLELKNLCNGGHAAKAEQVFKTYSDSFDIPPEETLSCCNLILWGWTRTNLPNAAERSERWLESMPVAPSVASYQYILEAWSRAKNNSRTAGRRAETLLRKLQDMGLQDQVAAYHCALKACSRSKDGDRAMKLLNEMLQQEYQNGQVKMNKHLLATVLLAFKSMPQRAEIVLENSEKNFGLKPDLIHYSIVLDAWSLQKNGPRAEALFNKMLTRGVRASVVAYNALIYAWRDDLDRTEELFQAMVRDYLECPFHKKSDKNSVNATDTKTTVNTTDGDEQNEVGTPRFSPAAAVRPNVQSLANVLTAQSRANAPERAEALLAWVINDERIRRLIEPNIFCWTAVLNGYAQVKQPEKAEAFLRRIQQVDILPNVVSYTTVMHAWASVGNPARAMKLWEEMLQHGLQPNQYSLNTLIMAYANARQPEAAAAILKDLPDKCNVSPDLAAYASLLRAWELSNMPEKARALLEELRTKEIGEGKSLLDITSYNTVLSAYSNSGMVDEAEELLKEMIEGGCRGIRPDGKSFAQVLLAYTRSYDEDRRSQAGDRAEEALRQLQELGVKSHGVMTNVALHCFAISGNPQKAEDKLRQLISLGAEVDTVALNTCLNAWARLGDPDRAESLLLDFMCINDDQRATGRGRRGFKRRFGFQPDVQTFSIILLAWSNVGTVEAAEHSETILEYMGNISGSRCTPDTVAYNTVLRAWLNAASASRCLDTSTACAERAEKLLSKMEDMNYNSLPKNSNQIRPDRQSYSAVIQIWRLAKNNKRAQILIDKSPYSERTSKPALFEGPLLK